ncbi:S-layer homology domain-containing protein [Paenibacillus sp. GCM10027627]
MTKVISGDVTCSAKGLGVADPAIGALKSCDIRDLQLDSEVTLIGSGDHRAVTVSFHVYAAQAGTLDDLRSKITVQKTGATSFTPLGINDIVSDLTTTAALSSFTINFEHALVGSENVIRIDAGAFVDSNAAPYNQIIEIDSIQFGSGTASSPYEIATADQLNQVRNHLGKDVFYKLVADIDLINYSSVAGWVPIGDIDTPFEGHIDGNGYTIKNLTINDTNGNFVGLFGYLSYYAVITNMKLVDVTIHAGTYVGGLVGYNGGDISNSFIRGSINGSSYVGGLVGMNIDYAKISNSYAAANINGSSRNTGGLVGWNNGDISNSYATGSLSGGSTIGGLVGRLYGTISNSYASGSVNGNDHLGGLVGMSNLYASISSSYATGSVAGGWNLGGFVGYQDAATVRITNSYYDINIDNGLGTLTSTADMKLQSTYTGFDFSDGGGSWGIDPSYNNGYPYLKAAVAPPAVISVSVNPVRSNVAAGLTKQLTAAVATVGGAAQTVTWASNNNDPKVTVDLSGLVTVAADAEPGDYIFTATSTFDIGKVGTATITVTQTPSVRSVVVSPATASVVQGANQQLVATVMAAGGASQTVAWTSNDNDPKVTVDSRGLVTVAADAEPGDYIFTATSTFDIGKVGTATITVTQTPSVRSVVVSPATASVVQGANQQLVATVMAVGGASQTVAWTSNDNDPKVTVDARGLVTVASDAELGNYTFTAISIFDLSKSGTASITVTTAQTPTPIPTPTPTPTAKPIPTPIPKPTPTSAPELPTVPTETHPVLNLNLVPKPIDLQQVISQAIANSSVASFPDVNQNSWSANAVNLASKLGIITGYSDGNFHGSEDVSRAEFATMIVRALSLDPSNVSTNETFLDTEGHWAEAAINVLKEAGILTGVGDGSFKPDQSVTRAEIAAILARVMQMIPATSNSFTDTSTSWAQPYIEELYKAHIITGTGNNQFQPNAHATRVESVVMIMRMLNQALSLGLEV